MDCESCGRHRPSDQVVAHWSPAGAVIMACARCRRLTMRREDLSPGSATIPAVASASEPAAMAGAASSP
jgi:ribosome-binding protein aMBF1 (putative translation factor)